MRTSLAGSGFSVALGEGWQVSVGWSDPALQRLHGVYFEHRDGLQMHVRCGGPAPRRIADLRALLRQQNWASAPYDEIVVDEPPAMASALFEMLPRDIVLEGFVTDGRQVAHFAMPGPSDAVRAVRSAAERLVRGLRFDTP